MRRLPLLLFCCPWTLKQRACSVDQSCPQCRKGRCRKGVDSVLDGYPKLVAIDEEADHQVVHRRRFGKHPLEGSCQEAKRLPYATFGYFFSVAFRLTYSTPNVWPQTHP